MKGSQEKLDRFPCTSCGLCCKNITGIIELIGFDAGNGVCKFLDLETNLCKIYERCFIIALIENIELIVRLLNHTVHVILTHLV